MYKGPKELAKGCNVDVAKEKMREMSNILLRVPVVLLVRERDKFGTGEEGCPSQS
jgi:hypothetical protein